ncbi:hypothetical protein, partial [Psittacicella hinzii]
NFREIRVYLTGKIYHYSGNLGFLVGLGDAKKLTTDVVIDYHQADTTFAKADAYSQPVFTLY